MAATVLDLCLPFHLARSTDLDPRKGGVLESVPQLYAAPYMWGQRSSDSSLYFWQPLILCSISKISRFVLNV